MADLTRTKERSDDRGTDEGVLAARPQLFLLLESARPLASSVRISLHDVESVSIGRGAERAVRRVEDGRTRRVEITIPDGLMSSTHARLWKLHGRWVAEDKESKNGTVINGERLPRAMLGDRDLLELGQTFFMFRDAAPSSLDDPAVFDAAELSPPRPELATFLVSFRRELEALDRAARSPVSVMILGASGTGKDVVARALHDLSGRTGSFVAVNCGALPDTLVEGELFGSKKGAYSGADEDRAGLIRAADKGTLLLDEIGDLPEASQVAFLRVLQEREVVAIGDTKPIKVDFRLVAATHRDLDALAERGTFRRDLYARISGLTLHLPSVAERPEDLGILIAALLRRIAGDEAEHLSFNPKAARAILRHTWPLNVRELEKCLETAVALAEEGSIEVDHLPRGVRSGAGAGQRGPSVASEPESLVPAGAPEPLSAEDEEIKRQLVALLNEHAGNISAVSRAMGKARMQIHRWIRRFDIELDQFRR